jgi:SAM-dependent methyltransferase
MTTTARASKGARMVDDEHEREYGDWLDAHADVLRPDMLVLELGCGTGDDARFLLERGLTVFGLDLSPDRVSQAARRAPGAHFVVGDLAVGLPFRSMVADLVVASLSLHYFDRRTTRAILRDIARVLRKDGMMLCRVNVVGQTISRWGEGVEREPDFFEVEPGRFKRFFSRDSLQEMLSRDFVVESIEPERTRMSGGLAKDTLVARARRRE